jgi:hypothetical protein
MKKPISLSFLLLVAATGMNDRQSDFPKLEGPYLGQKPPLMKSEICANKNIS